MAQTETVINIITTKVEFVNSQTHELHRLLDAFVNKEIAAFEAVTDTGKQDLKKIRGINSRLDTVLEFLLGKCAEINSFASGTSVDLQQQQLHTSTSASSSMINSSEISEIFDHSGTLEATELNKSGQEKKIHILEEKLENLISEIADKEKMAGSKSGTFVKKRKIQGKLENDQTKRLQSIEVQLHHLVAKNSDISEDLDTRIYSVKDTIKHIEDECMDIKNSLQKKGQETILLTKTAEDLSFQMNTLKSFKDETLRTVANLTSRMDSIEQDVDNSTNFRKNEENQIVELQDRVSVVEGHRNNDLDYYKRKLEETDNLYKQVCEMVASKMKPLLRLQEILSKYHRTIEMQEEVASQSGVVSADVSDPSVGADSLGSKRQRVPVGFTAYWGDHSEISGDTTLIFTDVLCNEGNCYDSVTGNFTAPYTGLYLASLTLRQRDIGTVNAHIRLAKSRHFVARGERTVCRLLTNADKTSCCDAGVVRMKAGDRLFVFTMEVGFKPRLSFYSSFSCILIG